ncbi:hypothetical protein Pla175_12880 [Pirellulimonas nuda]|uniref:Uncharacterized protein n=1 Tax=Pirellulimonas nuda TaxID=2528009 RepID=A0A518D8W5_9BACT|nr:AAA family ATPase [Pirellulimonas nuda]QDU87921.1 hypothetical protein Pla175_12880 [Pirellulimonas nuda]
MSQPSDLLLTPAGAYCAGAPPAVVDLLDAAAPKVFMSAQQVAAGPWGHSWILPGVLVRGTPAVLYGPPKSLLSSIAIDLAVSVALGLRWFGTALGLPPTSVAMLVGSSDLIMSGGLLSRVCRSKGRAVEDVSSLHLRDNLRLLRSDAGLNELQTALRRVDARLIIIDPLSLAIGGGGFPMSDPLWTENQLYELSECCMGVGATPLFVDSRHHPDGPPAFFQQWIEVSRVAPYAREEGRSELRLEIGGAAGQSSVHQLSVTEGVADGCFEGRCWEPRIQPDPHPSVINGKHYLDHTRVSLVNAYAHLVDDAYRQKVHQSYLAEEAREAERRLLHGVDEDYGHDYEYEEDPEYDDE